MCNIYWGKMISEILISLITNKTKLRTTGSIKAGLYIWKFFPFPLDTLMCWIISLGLRLLEREPIWNCIFKYFGHYSKTMVWLKKKKQKQTNTSLRNKIEQKVAREFLLVMEFFRTPNKTSKPQNKADYHYAKHGIKNKTKQKIFYIKKSTYPTKVYIKELSKKKKLIMWVIIQIYLLRNFNAIMLQFSVLGIYLPMIC